MSAPPPGFDRSTDGQLFESSPDCAKVLDLDGRLHAMNRNGQCLMEIDDFEALRGRAWTSLWPGEAQPDIEHALATARAGGTRRFPAFCPTAKGTPKWWDIVVSPIRGGDGRPVALLSVSRDITELELARHAQHDSAERLRFMMDATRTGEWELDLETGQVRTSVLHDRCFGYDARPAEWNYDLWLRHVHPDDRERASRGLQQTIASGQARRDEYRVVWPDGSVHWLDVWASVYRPRDDRPARVLGTVRDITDDRHAQSALNDAELQAARSGREAEVERARLNALLEAAPVGIVYCDAEGRALIANAIARETWGVRPMADGGDSALCRGWWPEGAARSGAPLDAGDWPLARVLSGEDSVARAVVALEPRTAPGTRRTVQLQAARVHDEFGATTGAVLVQLDISDQLLAEAALRESEARFRTITNAMPQMVWSTRADGYPDYFSAQWYAYTGAPEGATDGSQWASVLHAEDRARSEAAWRASVATGAPYEVEYRMRHHSGEYRWVLARALPLRDAAGAITRWMGTCTDIHDHKLAQAAVERSQQALRLADRRKDEFLAMLAHELRNPLAPISTAAHVLRKAADDPARVRSASDIIVRQTRHMTELVDDLLDVSRVTRGLVDLDREVLDLKTVVAGAIEQARPLMEARGHLFTTTWAGAAPVPVVGDRTRLVQVVANLLNNAAKYTPPRGQIDVRVEIDGEAACLQVSDNGIGIEPALLPGIFDLFTQGERTPDRSQGGLGIGLAVVKNLVLLHGGRVDANSQGPQQGSTFTIHLPLAPRMADAKPAAPTSATRAPRGLRVLAVDDNEDAAQMLAELLTLDGHEVALAHSAADALAFADQQAQAHAPPQVCILDIGLPDMTGYDLVARLRDRLGAGPTVFIALTGYGQANDRQLSKAAGFDHHLVKPVDAVVLLELLARLRAPAEAAPVSEAAGDGGEAR